MSNKQFDRKRREQRAKWSLILTMFLVFMGIVIVAGSLAPLSLV